MNNHTKQLCRRAVLALVLLGSPFSAIAQTPPVPGGDGMFVYNAQHKSLVETWAAGFTADTGIKVTIRKGGDTELSNQIVRPPRRPTCF
jgi:iron(III) transport system substrate-binding protein